MASLGKLAGAGARLLLDRGFLLYLANFAVGKGIAFIGPILLGLSLAPGVYGGVEFGLATAQLAAMILTLGVPSAAMQLVLMRQGRRVTDLLGGVAAAVGAISLLAATLLGLLGAETRWPLTATFVALCAAQQCGVAFARAHGRRNFNVWIDHAPTIAAVVLALALATVHRADDLKALVVASGLLGLALAAVAGRVASREAAPAFIARLRDASAIGLPMVGASMIGAWMVSSSRVYAGLLLGDDDVFAYAFTFRVASLLVLLHAVVMTGFAARLYKMPTRRFDPLAAGLIAILAAGALVLILVAPEFYAVRWFSPSKAPLLDARPAVALIAAQVFFWVASATLEQRVSRARMAGLALRLNLAVAIAVAFTLFVWNRFGSLGFGGIAAVLLVQQAVGCATQFIALAKRRVAPRKTAITTVVGGALVTAAAAYRVVAGF